MAIHVFPLELRESRKSWPYVAFSVSGTTSTMKPQSKNFSFSEDVFFPIPQGLTFTDGMNYSSVNLGLLGEAGVSALDRKSTRLNSSH